MAKLMESFVDSVDTFMAWVSSSLKQTTEAYCDLETADSRHVLVAHDGSLISVLKIHGSVEIIGQPEFDRIVEALSNSLRTAMSQPGYALQVYFSQDQAHVKESIDKIYGPAYETANKLNLDLEDLFHERREMLASYCSDESVFFVFWTRPVSLGAEQLKQAQKDKAAAIKAEKIPPFKVSQNLIAAIPQLRDSHDAFVRAVINDLERMGLHNDLLDVHTALHEIRNSVDPEFTEPNWRPSLPGDKIPVKEVKKMDCDVADLLWPSLSKQVIPRDSKNLDMRTCQIGDKIYSAVFISLFPKDIKSFIALFSRTLAAKIPWRMSYWIESEGLPSIRLKSLMASLLSFSSTHNRLISDSNNLLKYLDVNSDDAMIRMQVSLATWAPEGENKLLRTRSSELAKAVQGWGSCETAEYCGDAFEGVISSAMGVTSNSPAPASIAPLSHAVYMLPITRPASSWDVGALMYRTPDGKLWPCQPGSKEQTTWIDIVYARPGSGKSVLSNAMNLALCLLPGLTRLPRIAIIDIGPSSSGLISLLKEALPPSQRHLAAHHRIRMTPEYSINPFDTQLGCRFPNPSERAFLVNFLTLLATPIGADKPYDAIPDMAGMVVDELYKELSDEANAHIYAPGIEPMVDGILEEIGFVQDVKTTWWEVTDALFAAGFTLEAHTAQRYTAPLLADAASICRLPAIDDLYGKISTPTGENLIDSFGRMISGAVREYPILSRVTSFDIGESRVVALDLDEVAKSGGDAADRQTAVMYMLARYVLARHYYLIEDNVKDIPEQYQEYHYQRVAEIREDPKRIVYDEFHRTAKSQAVRDQVVIDMREGRKWKVQIGLLSQSLEDFDDVMIEFATSIYIMDAGPAQSIARTGEVFGLSDTAKVALRTRVHGPREGGGTFLAQFATKSGLYTQLLTLTLGPIELWAFSTTSEDAIIRNKLYRAIGPGEARRVLATLFPYGTATKELDARLNAVKEEENTMITEDDKSSMVDNLIQDILDAYAKDPHVQALPSGG